MAKQVLLGQTTSSRKEYVVIRDVNGNPITGLVYTSTGLIAYYVLPGAASAQITLATQTVTGGYSSGGFVEVDSAHAPGLYRFDIPNAAFASGNDKVIVVLSGYSGMAPIYLEYEITAYDPQNATNLGLTDIDATISSRSTYAGGAVASVTAGVTVTTNNDKTGYSLTQAFPSNFSSLSVDGSGRVDVGKVTGTAQTARDLGASVLLSSGTGTGQLDFTSGVVKSNLAQILGTALTETAGQIAAAFKQFFNIASPTSTMNLVTAVGTLTTYTGNTPQTGDSYARIGAAGAGLTALGDTRIANLDASVSSRSTYAGADTSGTTTLLGRIPGTVQAQSGDSFTRLGAPVGATISADVAAVKLDLDGGVGLTSGYQATLVAAVWAAGTRTLTSLGTVVADVTAAVWAAGTRTLTAFGFTVTTDVSSTVSTNLNATVASRSTYAGADTPGTTTLLTRVPGVVQPQTGDAFALIGTAGVGLTNLGDARLADLDASVASRSTYAGGPVASVTAPVGLTSAYDPAKTAAQPGDAMALTSGERTTLTGVIWAAASRSLTTFGSLVSDTAAAVWAAATRTLSGFSFTVNTTDTPPDNTSIAAIKAKTDNLPVSPAATGDIPTATQNADALLKRDWAAVSGEAAHSVINALRGLGICNRVNLDYVAGTITIYLEDGVTIHKTIPFTTDTINKTIVGVTP